MAKKKIEIDVAAGKDQSALSLVDKLASKLRVIRKENTASGETLLERTISKGPAGIADSLGDLVGVGKLGIAGAILDQIAGGIGKVSSAMAEVREHKKTWATLWAEDFPRAIPIVGQLYGAIRDLRDELDGTSAAVAKMEKSTQRTTERMKNFTEAGKAARDNLRALRDEFEATGSGGDKNSFHRQQIDAAKNYDREMRRIKDERTKEATSDMAPGQRVALSKIHDQEELEASMVKFGKERDIDQEKKIRQKDSERTIGEELLRIREDQQETLLRSQQKFLEADVEHVENEGKRKVRAIQDQIREMQENGLITPKSFDDLNQQIDQETKRTRDHAREMIQLAEQEAVDRDNQAFQEQARSEQQASRAESGRRRQEAFHAELLGNRYRGLAAQARDDPMKKSEDLLTQILGAIKKPGERGAGDGRRFGRPLGYR